MLFLWIDYFFRIVDWMGTTQEIMSWGNGGVLTKSMGHFICLLSCLVVVLDSNEAEMLAFKEL